MEAKGPITDIAYSSDGAFLAVIDEKKVATAYSVADGYSVKLALSCKAELVFHYGEFSLMLYFFHLQVKNEFYGHHAKPVSLAWSPDNEHFATGGMDMMVYIWTIGDADKRIKLPGWH